MPRRGTAAAEMISPYVRGTERPTVPQVGDPGADRLRKGRRSFEPAESDVVRGATVTVRGADPAARRGWPWVVFTLSGMVAAGLYAADVGAMAAFGFVGIGCVIALFVGPRWHRAQPRRPWRLLSYTSVLFLIGALVRPFVVESTGATALLADACTVPGYLFMIGGLADFLSARRGVERHALIDGLIVCVGAAIASALLFAVPAASIQGRPAIVSALAGLYPLFDVVLVLLLANLAFTTAVRRPSFVLLVATVLCVLAGDVSYAIIGISGELYTSRFLDLPFLIGFTMMGAAALHPSAAHLGQATALPIQEWSWTRLLVICPALATPFVLTATIAHRSPIERTVLGIGGAVIVALLLMRAVSAVQSYAAAQRRYQHQATHDPLTGLPNRRALAVAVDELLARRAPEEDSRIWMFFLDLDGFKFVNDSWGHSAGDQLIVDVGVRLRAALPASATVARVGGDEFVVVQLCDQQHAMELARLIMECLRDPLQVHNAEVVITGSMGIASADPATEREISAEGLMRDADTAMYRTKAEGRGKWTVFDASMYEAVRERIEIQVALRAALAQEQLHVEYQPIVDLPSGRVEGAEALARWVHPERGPIGPNIFIPIAEDSSLITEIGNWVLGRSIQQLAGWRAAGTVADGFWMSINVSARQLTEPTLPGFVAAELMRWEVPARCVTLEITESVMVDGGAQTDQVLKDLRALGVGLSVDDFGTGFSALGYLRRHPLTGVKIDRSFVSGLGDNAEDEEIVRAVVAMSTALGLAVVAEGVETAAQRDVLAGLGVSLGQGWLWGRAIRPPEFAERWGQDAASQRREAFAGNQAAGNS